MGAARPSSSLPHALPAMAAPHDFRRPVTASARGSTSPGTTGTPARSRAHWSPAAGRRGRSSRSSPSVLVVLGPAAAVPVAEQPEAEADDAGPQPPLAAGVLQLAAEEEQHQGRHQEDQRADRHRAHAGDVERLDVGHLAGARADLDAVGRLLRRVHDAELSRGATGRLPLARCRAHRQVTDEQSTRGMSPMDRYFQITERGSTVGREVRGGVVTFFTMAYIIVLTR